MDISHTRLVRNQIKKIKNKYFVVNCKWMEFCSGECNSKKNNKIDINIYKYSINIFIISTTNIFISMYKIVSSV